jgi:pimeloyl-ACP methyl ester carboxylesterase
LQRKIIGLPAAPPRRHAVDINNELETEDMLRTKLPFALTLAVTTGSALMLVACGGSDSNNNDTPGPIPEESRPHDTRAFTSDATATTFTAMAAAAGDTVDMSTTSRWAGVMGGANYRVEVPANWNGKLVMYAHGYAGNGAVLGVSNVSIRRHLIQNGYAWAASSYSKNYYDVRAGVEDTNALALAFNDIAAKAGRVLAAPSRTYIIGHSMGGHITAAAIEDEAATTAKNKVKYAGAVPMCGVVGDTELFNQFAAMQVTAQALAGVPAYPSNKFADVRTLVTNALFTTFPTATTPAGAKYLSVLKNITGGERPMFAQGIAFGGSFPSAWGTFGSDGTLDGVLIANVLDTSAYTYTIDGDAAGSTALNAAALKITAAADSNRLRRDGLRWVPKVNGEFKIPVVSIHTLGDLFVPFSMEQTYQKRTAAKGNSAWLVQRAIRGASHCDFTIVEQVEAFEAMVKWERDGVKPTGDDVVTPATVAAPTYGCAYTRNTLGPDDGASTRALRAGILGSTPACPI